MLKAIRQQDSVMHKRDTAYLVAKGYLKTARDTIGIEEDEVETKDLQKITNDKNKKPVKDTVVNKPTALLPKEADRQNNDSIVRKTQ